MERQKTVNDIGTLAGKVLLFGGVYSNLQALQAMKRVAEEQQIPAVNVICTGDVVGYCAQPEECVNLIQEWGIHTIAGNVEIQLREKQDDCGCDFNEESRCDIFSRNWYNYAKHNVSDNSLVWMESLPDFMQFSHNNKLCYVVHGSCFVTSDFIFKSTPWEEKQKNFDAVNADTIIAGHCGLPFADKKNDKLWLNAGVIGMPANDGDTRVWYSILDTDTGGYPKYSFHQLDYDNTLASELMLAKGLPQQYAKTIIDGIWDNCEILPAEETAAQGKPLLV